MPGKQGQQVVEGLTFSEACNYLGISPEALAVLRDMGLAVSYMIENHQIYPKDKLEVTHYLLHLAYERKWSVETVAWYADLLFAAEFGRTFLLPIDDSPTITILSDNWLRSPLAATVLDNLKQGNEEPDVAITSLLRSLVKIAVGQDRFWPSKNDLKASALYPIITYLEEHGTPIFGQDAIITRDAANNYALMVLAFGRIAFPVSPEFVSLVQEEQLRLKNLETLRLAPPAEEQAIILGQPLIPVDKIYASKINEIHTAPKAWDFSAGVLSAQRRTILVQVKLPADATKPLVDNIIDMIAPYVGSFGARVVRLLYEIANDPPYFRTPVITIDTNVMLDRLGLKRDKNGFHRSKNRERLRDALNAAHALEIVGEFTTKENGKPVVKAFYRTVLSIIGATFDPSERQGISTAELRTRGLPKSMQIRLNFYDGIRQPNGKLGNQYVMLPRLAESSQLVKANYAATHELLREYLFFRYRQTRMKTRELKVKRSTALEKTNITNKNPRRATMTLRKALERLVQEGTLVNFSSLLPAKPQESFTVILSESAVKNMKPED